MLTLVAAVLAYDLAYEPVVDLIEGLEARDAWSLRLLLSRNAMSETSDEKDIMWEEFPNEATEPMCRILSFQVTFQF